MFTSMFTIGVGPNQNILHSTSNGFLQDTFLNECLLQLFVFRKKKKTTSSSWGARNSGRHGYFCSGCLCWCNRETTGEWMGESAQTEKEQCSLIKIYAKRQYPQLMAKQPLTISVIEVCGC